MSLGSRADIPKSLLNPVKVIDGKVHAPRTPALVVILLHRHAHREIVDDGYHLAQVPGQQAVKKHLVAVVQRGQIDVLVQRVRQALVLRVSRFHLRFERADHGG